MAFKLLLDNKEIELEGDFKTLEDVVIYLNAKLGEDKKAIKIIDVEVKDEFKEEFEKLEDKYQTKVEWIDYLKITTDLVENITKETVMDFLMNLSEYKLKLDNFISILDSSVDNSWLMKIEDVMVVLDDFGKSLDSILVRQKVEGKDIEKSFFEYINRYKNLVEEIFEAINNADRVALRDIVQYELKELIEDSREKFANMIR